jgi:dsRNA-specific ribonuclease
LDIKPYIPAYDSFPTANYGWLEKAGAAIDDPDFQKHPPPYKSKLRDFVNDQYGGDPQYLWSLDFSTLTIKKSYSFEYSSDQFLDVGKKSGRKKHEQLCAKSLLETLNLAL